MNVKLKLMLNELTEKIEAKTYNTMRIILTPLGMFIDWVDRTNDKLRDKERRKAEAMTTEEVVDRMIKTLINDLIYERKHSRDKMGEVKMIVASNSNTEYNPPTLQRYMRRSDDNKLKLFVSKYKYSDVDFSIKYSKLIVAKLSAMKINNLTIDIVKEDYKLRFNAPNEYINTIIFRLK